jgi:hypothetical protein
MVLEIAELQEHLGRRLYHYLMVDDRYTWWEMGRSYLCRIVDIIHMGLIDDALFGREVLTPWPSIVMSVDAYLRGCLYSSGHSGLRSAEGRRVVVRSLPVARHRAREARGGVLGRRDGQATDQGSLNHWRGAGRVAADLAKKYGRAASIRSLAEQTGRSYGFVHRILTESGVSLRGRGGATPRRPRSA